MALYKSRVWLCLLFHKQLQCTNSLQNIIFNLIIGFQYMKHLDSRNFCELKNVLKTYNIMNQCMDLYESGFIFQCCVRYFHMEAISLISFTPQHYAPNNKNT